MQSFSFSENRLIKNSLENPQRNQGDTQENLRKLQESIGSTSENASVNRSGRRSVESRTGARGRESVERDDGRQGGRGRDGRNSVEDVERRRGSTSLDARGERRKRQGDVNVAEVVRSAADTQTPEQILSGADQPRVDGPYLIFSSEGAFENYLNWWQRNFEDKPQQVKSLRREAKRSRRETDVQQREKEVGGFVIRRMYSSRQAMEKFKLLTADRESLRKTIADMDTGLRELAQNIEYEGETVNDLDQFFRRLESCESYVSRIPLNEQNTLTSQLKELGYEEYVGSNDFFTLYSGTRKHGLYSDTGEYDGSRWRAFVRIADDAGGQVNQVQWTRESLQQYGVSDADIAYFRENVSDLTYSYSRNMNRLWDLGDVVQRDADRAETRQTDAQRNYDALQERRDRYAQRLAALER